MADYIARMSKGPDLPVVTHDTDGMAMVYNPHGQLVRASLLNDFVAVEPTPRKTWKIGGTFGSGAIAEVQHGEGYPWL